MKESRIDELMPKDCAPHEDCRGKAEYSFVKKVKILKLHKGGACSTFSSLEREGDYLP